MQKSSDRLTNPLPILLRWHETAKPLPTCVLQSIHTIRPLPRYRPQPGRVGRIPSPPFDFCAAMQRIIADISRCCPVFRHIEAQRILVTVTQARNARDHGLQARVTPLRFPQGQLIRKLRGLTYHIQRYFLNENEFLYVMTFCLPRFLNQSFDQKLVTLFHELFHLHPEFNGDLRRHQGRYQLHTHSQREYDKRMVQFAREYLAQQPDSNLVDFLRLDFKRLQALHGMVVGVAVPRPKIIPLVGPYLAAARACSFEPDLQDDTAHEKNGGIISPRRT